MPIVRVGSSPSSLRRRRDGPCRAGRPPSAKGAGAGSSDEAASAKEDVNRRNADGSTPLQWAVYNGDVAEAKRLLRAGANVSLANNYGATPMSLAAEVGNTEMLKVLLEAGANADSPNADGRPRSWRWRERATSKRRSCCSTTAPPSMRKRSGADRRR